MQSSSNSTLDRLLRWVKEGTRLYEEDEKFDVCRPNKSTLIHYHDAEKGKEKGSVEHQMMIFSIMSPACVSKLGWSCEAVDGSDGAARVLLSNGAAQGRHGRVPKGEASPIVRVVPAGLGLHADVRHRRQGDGSAVHERDFAGVGKVDRQHAPGVLPQLPVDPRHPFSGLLQAGEPGGRHAGRLQSLLFLRVRDSRQCASVLEVQADGPSIGEAVLQDRGPL